MKSSSKKLGQLTISNENLMIKTKQKRYLVLAIIDQISMTKSS
jgi:hypothetical protein